MARGKKAAASANRRAQAAAQEVSDLKAELASQKREANQRIEALKLEVQNLKIAHAREIEEAVTTRFDESVRERVEEGASALFERQVRQVRQEIATSIGDWLTRHDIKTSVDAYNDLAEVTGLSAEMGLMFKDVGNRKTRRLNPRKSRAHFDTLRQVGL